MKKLRSEFRGTTPCTHARSTTVRCVVRLLFGRSRDRSQPRAAAGDLCRPLFSSLFLSGRPGAPCPSAADQATPGSRVCPVPSAMRATGGEQAARPALPIGYSAAASWRSTAWGPRTRRPGSGAGRLAVAIDRDAGDDRRHIAFGTLVQAAAAGRQVVHHLERSDIEPLIVDDVEVGLVAGRDQRRDPRGRWSGRGRATAA